MADLLALVLPVFLVIGAGYVMRWRTLVTDDDTDALMRFTQGFAIPVLLFRAISTLDLSAGLHPSLLFSFYGGAISGFVLAFLGARLLFHRPLEDSVAIGFCGLFSNSLLLGLPITERAYGADALTGNYAIIAVHSPICYGIGITAMEVARARGGPLHSLPGKVARAMLRQPLIIGIALGITVNLTGLPQPQVFADACDLIARAALPVALFGLGGTLFRYRPEGDLRTIAMVCAISLLAHPSITWLLGQATGLQTASLRSAVVTAAMAPGINVYVFANMYGVAKRVAASAVLIGTALTVLTATFWLTVLP